jgi:recombinational DNA repair protein (RecF pathway)
VTLTLKYALFVIIENMREYVTEAVVLAKDPLRDRDTRYFFFTKRFGKVIGKATSARKITSKLAGHLEPGNLVEVRLVERNGGNGNSTQIADALKTRRLALSLSDLNFLNALLHEGEADPALWGELIGTTFLWSRALAILGWDPAGAVCEECGKKVTHFYLQRQEFFCVACASKLERDKLLLLSNGEL